MFIGKLKQGLGNVCLTAPCCNAVLFWGDLRSRISIGFPFVWCLNKPWSTWGDGRQVEVFKKRDGSGNGRKETEMGDSKSNHFCPWLWVTASVKGWRGKIKWWRQRDWNEDYGRGEGDLPSATLFLLTSEPPKLCLYLQRYFTQA